MIEGNFSRMEKLSSLGVAVLVFLKVKGISAEIKKSIEIRVD